MSASPTIAENSSLSRTILARGVFYHPAGLHYGNSAGSVTCDRCHRTDILACIGFDRYDYCLPCVEAVARVQPTGFLRPELDSPPITFMVQNALRPPLTPTDSSSVRAMSQKMYKLPATRMMDSMYRREDGGLR